MKAYNEKKKKNKSQMIKTFVSISTFCLLVIIIFQIQPVKGETESTSISISIKGELSTITIPASVSTWIDTELSKAKRKILLTQKQFFTMDTAKVLGYINGYKTDLGFNTVKIDVTNNLTKESRPIISEIDSLGRFICSIPMKHPQKLTISFGEKFFSLYLEPGQALALSFDWDDCVKTNGFRDVKTPASILFLKGPLAKLNYDLLSFQLKTLGYRHYWIMRTHTPLKYLAVMDSILVENDALVNKALKDGSFSKKVIEIQKNEALIANGFSLIDYASTKSEEGIQVPPNFYNMLQRLPLDDPSSIISFYAPFINRFEVNPVTIKAYRIVFEGKSDDLNFQSLMESERCLMLWHKKDSLLGSDLKLSSSFAYETTKIRSLSNDIQNMGKDEAFAYYAKLREGIKNPFLQQEGLRILRAHFGKEEIQRNDREINIPKISSTLPKWIPLSIPKGRDAEIFSKLIAPYKGKYLFVDFWGTSCGPCRWGIEEKKETREKYRNNDIFEFIFISCKTWSPNKNAYEKYVKEQGLEHSLFVSDDEFNYMMQLFRFTGVPHYLFIDPDGKVLDTDFEMFFEFDEAKKWIYEK